MSKKNSIEIDIIRQSNKKTVNDTIEGTKRDIKKFYADHKKTQKAFDEQAQKVFDERKEASRKVSLANKRIKRLEAKGMTQNPAYKALNGEYFSVAGKSQQQIQSMLRELDKFIGAVTSTVRGTNKYLKDMAKNTGVKYKNLRELEKIAPKFFELSSKTEQYLRNVEDMASAIDYNQIWEQVNVYVKDNKVDLSAADGDIDKMVKHVANALKKYEETKTVAGTTFRLKK